MKYQEIKQNAKKQKDHSHELKKGEIWLGNSSRGIPEDCKHIKSMRLGEQAYDCYGQPLSRNRYRPLIIHQSEEHLYNAVHANRMKKVSR